MKRNPRKLRWTKAFRKGAGKEMTVDSTLEFEKRRNIPVRYDRDLMQTTLKAMARIKEIKEKRERAFYQKRMAKNGEKVMADDLKEVTRNIMLVGAPEQRDRLKQTIIEKETILLVDRDVEMA